MRSAVQLPRRGADERGMCREEFGLACVADALQPACSKVSLNQLHGLIVCVGLAGDLAQQPVAAPRVGQHQCRAQFLGGEV